MAVSITPTNPGIVYDPRTMASSNWLNAVQADLNAQRSDLGTNPTNAKVGNWMPVTEAIFDPRKQGFAPGKKSATTPVGPGGRLVRIG